MPRTKLGDKADARKDLCLLIRSRSYAMYGSATQAAPHAGISQPTISRRLQDVDSFSIGEIRKLRKALDISKEEMLEALGGVL